VTRPRHPTLPSYRVCAHPGCENRMWRGSSTYDAGLCRDHGGQRRGRASVQVMTPVPVSLKAEPWG
jgi:hypothetical protein